MSPLLFALQTDFDI